LIFTSR